MPLQSATQFNFSVPYRDRHLNTEMNGQRKIRFYFQTHKCHPAPLKIKKQHLFTCTDLQRSTEKCSSQLQPAFLNLYTHKYSTPKQNKHIHLVIKQTLPIGCRTANISAALTHTHKMVTQGSKSHGAHFSRNLYQARLGKSTRRWPSEQV